MSTRRPRAAGFAPAVAILLAIGGAGGSVADEPAPPSFGETLRALGLDRDDARALLSGEIVAGEVTEFSDKELAVTVAVLVSAPVEDAVELVRSGRLLASAPDVIVFGELGTGPPAAGAFAGVRYTADETDEVEALLEVEAGDVFNLSSGEIARFAALGRRYDTRGAEREAPVRDAVSAEYRAVLRHRHELYRAGGVQAIAPYDRDGDTATPAKELAAAAQDAPLARWAPALDRAFARFPADAARGVEHRFYWIKQTVDDRPAFILAHRMLQIGADGGFIAERQYYVGHSYNSLQAVVGCLPVGPRTLVFHASRTSTDQVAGLGRRVRHNLGRRLARDAVIERLETLRAMLEEGEGDGVRPERHEDKAQAEQL